MNETLIEKTFLVGPFVLRAVIFKGEGRSETSSNVVIVVVRPLWDRENQEGRISRASFNCERSNTFTDKLPVSGLKVHSGVSTVQKAL